MEHHVLDLTGCTVHVHTQTGYTSPHHKYKSTALGFNVTGATSLRDRNFLVSLYSYRSTVMYVTTEVLLCTT